MNQPLSPRLRRGAILRTSESARTTVLGGGNVEVKHAGQRFRGRGEIFAVLDVFYTGRSLEAGLAELGKRAASSRAWIACSDAVMGLRRIGALCQEDEPTAALNNIRAGFDDPWMHINMLDDRTRTQQFIAAIRAVVRPGDVVLDIGTGTGVLAVAAALAGARRVYAIDVGNIAKAALALAEANGVADRIEVIQDWSAHVQLPEQCDVLVSEIIGDEPFSEAVLETFLDARSRLLKPEGRMIPNRVRVRGQLVTVSEAATAHLRFTDDATQRWRSWYGIDFAPLTRFNALRTRLYLDPSDVHEVLALGPSVVVADVDLTRLDSTAIDAHAVSRVEVDGACNGVMITFELVLAPGIVHSNAPSVENAASHWMIPVWSFAPAIAVEPGRELVVEYRRNAPTGANGASLQEPA